jgi:hypothetical protein
MITALNQHYARIQYESVRGELWRRLEDEMAPECWHVLQQMRINEKAYKLLDFDFLGGSVLADIIAPYVCACWQIRWKVRNEEVRSDGFGLGLGLLQRPAVARSWSHPGSWDCTVKHQRCVTEIQVLIHADERGADGSDAVARVTYLSITRQPVARHRT